MRHKLFGPIRAAIGKALAEVEEQHTAAAYRQTPDATEDAYIDPRVWEPTRGALPEQ